MITQPTLLIAKVRKSGGDCNPSAAARPIVFDLFCGLGGWTEAFLAEG